MVRLRGETVLTFFKMVDTFQFQDGAIKSVERLYYSAMLPKFQFQDGAIKRVRFT